MKTKTLKTAPKGEASPPKKASAVRLRGLEFPGCRPVYMTREDIASFKGIQNKRNAP